MIKTKLFLIVLSICSFIISPAAAFLKFDVGASASKAVTTVNNFLESAKKKMDEAVALQTVIAYGKGSIEAAKQIKSLKSEVEGKISEAKSKISEAKSKIEDFKEDPLQAGLDLAEEGLDDLSANPQFNELVSKIEAKTTKSQTVLNLKREKEKLEQELNDKLTTAKTTLDGKIAVYEKNNATLAQQKEADPDNADSYQQQIEANQAEIAKLQSQYDEDIQTLKTTSLSQITSLGTQMDSLNQELQDFAAQQKAKFEGELADKLMTHDSKGSLEETTGKNFLTEGNVETSEAIIKQKAYRNYVAGQDTLDAFAIAVTTQAELNDDNILTEKIANRTGAVDGSVAAINMDTQVKIQNIKALGKVIELMIQDLKLETSTEMAQSEINSITKDDNIANFSFDKYISKADKASAKEDE